MRDPLDEGSVAADAKRIAEARKRGGGPAWLKTVQASTEKGLNIVAHRASEAMLNEK